MIVLPGGGSPNDSYPYTYHAGMSGWYVYGVQVALNSHQKTYPIAEDGVIATDPAKSETIQCIIREQTNHHIKVDGILGPQTQRVICMAEITRAEKMHGVPVGLLYGLSLGESGFIFPAVSGPNWDGSYDAGGIQDNIPKSLLNSLTAWHAAFDLRLGCDETAAKLRRKFKDYFGMAGARTARLAWEAALVFHNWQTAADQMAAGTFDTWRYWAIDANGIERRYGVDDPAYWVISASRGRLQTGRQWRDDYVHRNAAYVTSWTS